jgi:hypothetical protein
MELMDCLDRFVKEYNLNKEDICIIGGTVMEYLGFRVKTHDIDIIVRNEARENLKHIEGNEAIDIRPSSYRIGKIRHDAIINNNKYYVYYRGYKLIKPEFYKRKIIMQGREKDIQKLKMMGCSPLIIAMLYIKLTMKKIIRLFAPPPPPRRIFFIRGGKQYGGIRGYYAA